MTMTQNARRTNTQHGTHEYSIYYVTVSYTSVGYGPTDSTTTNHYSKVRFQVPLPTFDGDMMCWCQFWELFNSSLEKDMSLNNHK